MTSHTFLGRHARSVVRALGQSLVISTTGPLPDATHCGAIVRLAWLDDDAQLLGTVGASGQSGHNKDNRGSL
jgi:hypothetical protein